MLVHLRRSVISIALMVFLGSCTPSPAPGSPRCCSSTRPTGRSPPTGPPSIGQNWARRHCPGHPVGSCVFQGRPDDPGPYAADPGKGQPPGGDNPLVGQRRQRRVRGHQPRTPLKALLANTEALVAYWQARASTPPPTWSPPPAAA